MKKNLRDFVKFFYRGGLWAAIVFVRASFGKSKLIKVNIPQKNESIFLRRDTSDISVFYQIFCEKDYDLRVPFDPEVIIDLGANIGLTSIFYKNRYPNSTIISVEPEKSNYEMVVQNTKQYPNMHCLNNGIWNRTTNLEIVNLGIGNWGFVTKEVDYENNNTISAISIDDIMKRFNIETIDILKVDVEGSEKELFQNNFENWLPKTKMIIVELHDDIREGASKSFFNAISQYNFSVRIKSQNIYGYNLDYKIS